MEWFFEGFIEMPGMFIALAAFFGAVMASFGGVVVERLPHQLGWRDDPITDLTIWGPSSRCDHCQRRLSAIDLIPVVGWLLCRGRCPGCGGAVPVVYPVMETLCAVVSGLIAAQGVSVQTLWTLGLLWAFWIVAWIDAKETWIPEVITLPLTLLGLLFSPFQDDPYARIQGLALGCVLVWSCFWLVGRAKKVEAMSGGDLAFVAMMGAWIGLGGVFDYLLLSVVIFLAYAIPLRLRGVDWVPMGPALAGAGIVEVLLVGHGVSILL
jgi:leader peptidase (prepilin peptidase)/N-methyltransferase